MCPFCFATAVVMTAGATSIAGLVPLAMSKLKPRPAPIPREESFAADRAGRQQPDVNR